MSPFNWSWRRIAYSSTHRTTMQEHNGWWRHVGFGLFIFRRKANPGWIYP